MNLGELLESFRDLADDEAVGALWQDPRVTIWLNEAVSEAARRARLIVDAVTVNDGADTPLPVCHYTLAVNDPYITLHPKVLFVRRFKLGSKDLTVPRIHLRDLDLARPGWLGQTASDIVAYCPNYHPGRLYLVSAAPAIDTVDLQVVRLPLHDMADHDADSPEIDSRYHMNLVHWALFRAYMKPDEDTQDKVKAGEHLAFFEAEFGKRSSAIDETWTQREYGYDEFEGLF